MNAKKIAAGIMIFSLLTGAMSTSIFAADATTTGSTTVNQDNTVTEAIVSFSVPDDLAFAVNAFQKDDATKSQIYSAGYQVVNKSDIPLQVSVSAKLIPGAGTDVVIVKDPKAALPVDASDTDKKVYMEMVAASGMTVDTEVVGAASADGTAAGAVGSVTFKDLVYGSDSFLTTGTSLGAQGAAKASLDTEDANFTYALKQASYINSGITAEANDGNNKFKEIAKATDGKIQGAAAFRFMGAVNPYATWAAADFKVSAVFDVRGMTTTMYDDAVRTIPATATKGLNMIAVKNASKAPSYAGAAITLPKVTGGTDVNVVLDLGMGDDGATGIKTIKVGTTVLAPTMYAFDADTNTLTLKPTGFATYAKGTELEIAFAKTGVTTYAKTITITYTT